MSLVNQLHIFSGVLMGNIIYRVSYSLLKYPPVDIRDRSNVFFIQEMNHLLYIHLANKAPQINSLMCHMICT